LYAYEVLGTQEECKERFPVNIAKLKYEPGEYVDIYDADEKDWKIGKIQHNFSEEKDEVSVVIEGSNKKITTPISSGIIESFMSRTVNYSEIDIFPLYHRHRNKDEAIVYFGIPKLLAIGIWATCESIVEEVLAQVKHFISLEGDLKTKKSLYPSKTVQDSKTKILSKSQTNVQIFDIKSLKVSLIDKTCDECAICNSRLMSGNVFLYKTAAQKCTGCNLLKYKDISLKFLVNYFGNVALCVDWSDLNDYHEPDIIDITKDDQIIREINYKPTLEECLKVFTVKEKIAEYTCDNCKNKGTSEVQVLISQLPDIFIVHLKRFLFMDTYIDKLTAKVTFPLQRLNMAAWISKSDVTFKSHSTEYDLYAVVNHHSSTASGGHYTAFVKSQQIDNTWVKCDDSILTNVTSDNIVTEDAYLLFYRKRVISTSNLVNLTYKAFT